mmetsp:Transcript_4782/g.17178  ORF Transcript_4782/g.17178 Transcript_4782/m.17178 type:complete len:458 (+) Transcript_4782:1-1374(+)
MIEWKSVGNSSVLEECIHPEVERIAKEVDVLNKTLEGVKSLILVADGKPHEAMILLKAAATGSETRNETEGTTSGSRRVDCFVRTVEALVHLARGEMQLACEQAESLKGLLYADDSADGPVCFRWITPVAFDTLLEVLAVCGRRAQAPQEALAEMEAADRIVADRCQVLLKAASEHARPSRELTECLTMRALMLQQRIQLELTNSKFEESLKHIDEMKTLCHAVPGAVSPVVVAVIHYLTGVYLHSVECFPEAISYFRKVISMGESQSIPFIVACARAYAALSFLANGASDCIGKAQEILLPSEDGTHDFHGACMTKMANACILLRQDRGLEAKGMLMDLLSEARKQEMEQLSAQILLHVATVTCQRGDPHQAREMLQSSITLAQGINDLQTSRNAIELLGSTPRDAGSAQDELELVEMEEQVCERLEGSIQLATQNHIHTTVVEGAKDMAQVSEEL